MADITNLGLLSKRPLQDQVTPYKVAILILFEEYCKTTIWHVGMVSPVVMTPCEQRSFLIMLLQLVQGPDMEMQQLILKITDIAKPHMLESVVDRLSCLFNQGIQAFMDLFEEKPFDAFGLYQNPVMHKSSVMGLFLRRMDVAFDKLSFSQVTKLYQRYRDFYEVWSAKHQKEEIGLDSSQFSDTSIIHIMEDDKKTDISGGCSLNTSILDTGRYSQRQAEYFIAQQAYLLHHNESEALSPKELQRKINELLNSNPKLAEAHYLSYMNHLSIKEYCGAMYSLCHYFDRHQISPESSNTPIRNKSDEETSSHSVRYSALNLAALHYRFRHRSEALAAVREAIRLAQENNDHICLQHALGWLQRLGVQGTSSTAYFLDRLVTKAEDLNLMYLTSLGIQAFAKHNALATATPSSVFEFLMRSDIHNCSQSHSDLMCVSYSHKAALWNMYGKREMMSLCSQLLLHVHTADLGSFHNGEAECLGLQHLARLHAQQGQYQNALQILDTAKKRFPQSSQHAPIWMLCEQQLLFMHTLYHTNWAAAEQAISNMAAIDSMEASYCQCLLLKERAEVGAAFSQVKTLIDKCKQHGEEGMVDAEQHARLLMLRAELLCITDNATSATDPLLVCLTLCRIHHLSYFVALTTVHLAHVQLSLGMPHQACSLIEEVLTIIMAHGSLYDQARTHFLWIKCQVASANITNRQNVIQSAVLSLTNVIQWFKTIEAHKQTKHTFYYQARLYHELGYIKERNKSAWEFRRLDQQYPTFHASSILSF